MKLKFRLCQLPHWKIFWDIAHAKTGQQKLPPQNHGWKIPHWLRWSSHIDDQQFRDVPAIGHCLMANKSLSGPKKNDIPMSWCYPDIPMIFPCYPHDSRWQALNISVDPALLKETVVLKLNGGLGTSMGLDKVGKPPSINGWSCRWNLETARFNWENGWKWMKIAWHLDQFACGWCVNICIFVCSCWMVRPSHFCMWPTEIPSWIS